MQNIKMNNKIHKRLISVKLYMQMICNKKISDSETIEVLIHKYWNNDN